MGAAFYFIFLQPFGISFGVVGGALGLAFGLVGIVLAVVIGLVLVILVGPIVGLFALIF